MQYFVTLTYKGLDHTIDDVMYDIKIWLKHERRTHSNLKYIWVAEYQKRGSIHIHMISNAKFTTRLNKNKKTEISYWADKHGFTSSLLIKNKDFDANFKPHLYLFKYMRKSQRIGKSFLHSSRNLNNFEEVDANLLDHPAFTVVQKEHTQHEFRNGKHFTMHFYRYYLNHVTIPSRIKYYEQLKDYNKWQKIILHSTKVNQRLQANHFEH